MTTRRTFVKSVVAAGGVATGLPRLAFAQDTPDGIWRPTRVVPPGRARASLSILILGGTGFTGPEQVDYALDRGHRVTLFNRGKTRPGLFKGKVHEELVGDLGGDASALRGKKFDVVIDNPTTAPFWVRNVAQYLKGNVGHYVFISTTSTYGNDQSAIGLNEDSPTAVLPEGTDPYSLDERVISANYGALKVLAEKEVQKHYPDRWSVIRPCLIVGPLDRTDRFTWWPARMDKGGDVLAPDKPDDPCQYIDSRDLAEWTVRVAEQKVLGLYNAIGPEKPMTVGELLAGVKAVTTAGAQLVWVPWEFLQANGVRPWRHMTVWQPPYGRTAGYQRRSAAKAIAKGLTFRPLAVTAAETLAWHKTRPVQEQADTLAGKINGCGLELEAKTIAAWRASQKAGF